MSFFNGPFTKPGKFIFCRFFLGFLKYAPKIRKNTSLQNNFDRHHSKVNIFSKIIV